ncbi:MAG: hypothetical protein HY355_04695 [Armatimonadetes bacterium]|nr:hypothetical protein [Armatimonadota bacterium]
MTGTSVTRRDSFERLKAGPALFSGLPGEEVRLEALTAHLTARGFEGGVYVATPDGEGVLWIRTGAPQDAWVFEADGAEALIGANGFERLRQMAARGAISVIAGAVPAPPMAAAAPVPPAAAPAPSAAAPAPPVAAFAAAPAAAGPGPPAEPHAAAASDVLTLPVPGPPASGAGTSVQIEPPPHPWPAILEEVAERVARHRGPKLAGRFTSALQNALTPHGGHVEERRITVPPLPESTWRGIVEAACAPIVAIAGRAFVDRTIAAAERKVTGAGEEARVR